MAAPLGNGSEAAETGCVACQNVPVTGTESSVAIVTRCVPASRLPVFIEIAVPPSWAKFVTVLTVVIVPELMTTAPVSHAVILPSMLVVSVAIVPVSASIVVSSAFASVSSV